MTNQQGTKRGNEKQTLEARLAHLEQIIRQIPSRFAKPAALAAIVSVVRVRFDCDGSLSRLDLSVGEILTDAAVTLNQEQAWIDGHHALAMLPPAAFGDGALYYAEKIGTETRSGTLRDLYRVVDYFGSASFPASPDNLVLETTTNGRCKVLNSSEAEVPTTIAGAAAVNRIMARLPSGVTSGSRLDWHRRDMAAGYAQPDSLNGILRAGGNGGLTFNTKVSIDFGEVFHLEVWIESGEVGAGFNPISASSSSTVAIIENGAAVVVRGTGNGWRLVESTTTSSRDYHVANVSWASLVLTVKDLNYASQTITFTLSRDAYGRIIGITATSSSGDIVPWFQARGGRFIP